MASDTNPGENGRINCDVVIIGAGPAGLGFARALADTGLSIKILEKSPTKTLQNPAEDGREIALTHLSVRLMKSLGAWARIDSESISPIKTARVFNGDSPYSLDFKRPDSRLEALGYLVPNHLIRKALYEEVAACSSVEILAECTVDNVHSDADSAMVTLSSGQSLFAPLVVSADSRFSESRRQMGVSANFRDFSRTAIVCRMQHELPHRQTAFECFGYGKTIALLPMNGNLSSVVVTLNNRLARSLIQLDDSRFNAQIQQWFGDRLGSMRLTGERHSYPLIGVHANQFVSQRYALVGDAAVGMHPVTAHGFNLGLRGADTLAAEIATARRRGQDIGQSAVLARYQRKHRQVTQFMYHGTNGIVGLFTTETAPARAARTLLLRVANNLPPVKRMITDKLTESDAQSGLPRLPGVPTPAELYRSGVAFLSGR